jgi:nucleoside phosphorylase
MEAAGLCEAAQMEGVNWIVVKSICDWADGSAGNKYQAFAATGAVEFVFHVFSDPHALDHLS